MKRRIESDNEDYERLRELGFHYKNSQGEFTYQPDSGSLSGGRLGLQENGIDSDFDAEGRREQRDHNPGEIILSYGPDDIERGQEAALSTYRPHGIGAGRNLSDNDLCTLIERRILNHPELSEFNIDVEVKARSVTLSGIVSSQSDKMRLTELVESLPGIESIRNEIDIV